VLETMAAALTAPDAAIYTPYGATEALPVAAISASTVLTETAALTRQGAGTCVGQPIGQIAVRIVRVTDGPDLSWMHADISRFRLPAPVALLVPGASPHRPEKRWPVAHFAALAMRLAAGGIGSAVLGAGTDAALAATIRAAAPDAIDLCGHTRLDDLVPLGRACVVAIGNDTGPMHWLAAAGAPVLTLFSSASDPDLCAPRGRRARILRCADLSELGVDDVADAAFGIADPGARPAS
jgi:hypothetical protein